MSDKPKSERSGELHPGPGFRVVYDVPRPAPGVVKGLAQFPTADISDQLNRLYTMEVSITALTPIDVPLAGPAVTVKVFPGDNLMVHKALDVVMPGDVIVVDGARSMLTALCGDMIATKAKHRGVAGFVIDGLVRDLEGIIELGGIPVFARGVTPIGPLHRGPGEVNVPVACGGVVVRAGDIVIGDHDGVVVVRHEIAGELLDILEGRREQAEAYAAAVARGDFSMAWVDAVLEQGGMDLTRPGSPPAGRS